MPPCNLNARGISSGLTLFDEIMKLKKLNRSIHKWGSIIIALPFIIILVTGILLLLKKEISYIQPPSQKGMASTPSISFAQILTRAQGVSVAQIRTWDDIDRLDVRPSKGIIKLRAKSQWEIQLDAKSGEVLQTAYRRSEFIESIHDGTFFQAQANLWLTLPISIILLFISITGVVLFFIPYCTRRKNKQRL